MSSRGRGRSVWLVVAGISAALTFTGCGESEKDDVTSVVEGYFDALSERDYASACRATSSEFKESLIAFARENLPETRDRRCEPILSELGVTRDSELVRLQKEVDVRSVDIDGDTATAKLEGPGQSAKLRKLEGDWKITRLDFGGASGAPARKVR